MSQGHVERCSTGQGHREVEAIESAIAVLDPTSENVQKAALVATSVPDKSKVANMGLGVTKRGYNKEGVYLCCCCCCCC